MAALRPKDLPAVDMAQSKDDAPPVLESSLTRVRSRSSGSGIDLEPPQGSPYEGSQAGMMTSPPVEQFFYDIGSDQESKNGSETPRSGKMSQLWEQIEHREPQPGIGTSIQDAIKLLPEINDFYKKKGREIPLPVWVLVGEQSSGKSTFVQRAVGFPMNITKTGTGTRRPLYISRRHNSKCQEPRCELDGEELRKEEVPERVRKFNKELEGQNKFESNELNFIVENDEGLTMMLVDPPGVKITQECTDFDKNGEDIRKKLEDIVKECVKKQHARLLVMLKPDEMTNNAIISWLDGVFGTDSKSRSKWVSKSTFVMNGSIVKNDSYQTPKAMADFLNSYKKEGISPYIVYSQPDAGLEGLQSIDTESYQRMEQHIKSLHAAEQELFRTHWPLSTDTSRLGFQKCVDSMYKDLFDAARHQVPQVITDLQIEKSRLQDLLAAYGDKSRHFEKHSVHRKATKLYRLLCKTVRSYMDTPEVRVLSQLPDCKSTLQDEFQRPGAFEDVKLNDYYQKETECFGLIKQELSRASEEYSPNDKLFGGQQYERQMAFFKVVLVEAVPNPENFMNEDVKSLMGALQLNIHQANWEAAILRLVQHIMSSFVHPLVNVFIKSVGNEFFRFYQIAKRDLEKSDHNKNRSLFAEMGALPSVQRFLDMQFKKMLGDLMHKAAEKCHMVVQPWYATLMPQLKEKIQPLQRPMANTEMTELLETGYQALAVIHNASGAALLPKLFTQDGSVRAIVGKVMELDQSGEPDWVTLQRKGEARGQKVKKPWGQRMKSLPFKAGQKDLARFMKQQCSEKIDSFAPPARGLIASMDDTEKIKHITVEYLLGLMQLLTFALENGFNCHLFKHFKDVLEEADLDDEDHTDMISKLVDQDTKEEEFIVNKKKVEDELKEVMTSLEAAKRFSSCNVY